MPNYLNIIMMLLLFFYTFYAQSSGLRDRILLGTKCVAPLTPKDASISRIARTELLLFNKPLDSITINQIVLFSFEEGGFGYAQVVDIFNDLVKIAFTSYVERTFPRRDSFLGIPLPNLLTIELKNDELSYQWVYKETLRRTLEPGDFIKYNIESSDNDIFYGSITRVDKDGNIFVQREGSQAKALQIFGRFYLWNGDEITFHNYDHITIEQIITVIDEDPEQYWTDYHNEQTGL